MIMKDFKAALQKYGFEDKLGHPLENCVDFIALLEAAQPKERFCFVRDDDGHDYLIPASKKAEFGTWVEHQQKLWGESHTDEEFKKLEAKYTGADFNDYRTGIHPSSYTFTDPQAR
jgi:hypothetical protein